MCVTPLGRPTRAQSSKSAVAPLWEVSLSCSRLSFGLEKLSSLFDMTKTTPSQEESCQHRAMLLAVGGWPPPSLLWEKGDGNFSQLFGCFAGDAL